MKKIVSLLNSQALIVLAISILSHLAYGQNELSIPLNSLANDYFYSNLQHTPHSAIRPYNPFTASLDSANWDMDNRFTRTWLGRKLFNEHLMDKKGADFEFIINPLFDLRLGQDNQRDQLLWVNTRGVQAMAKLGEKFIFYSDVYENQAQFPFYINQEITRTKVVPGQGLARRFGDKGARDYSPVSGYLTFQPNQFLNFQFGTGKHFLGDGYRSLLLSDNAFNYPYLRMMTEFWKIKYVNLFTQMQDINSTTVNQTFVRKYVTSHYLSIQALPKLTIGLFETVVYHDSTGTRGYDVNYLNPFIFYRPVEFALGSSGGNVLIGMNAKYQWTNNFYLYGQFLLDELKVDEFFGATGWWANKYSWQLGFKSFNTFIPHLMLQSEFNYVRPYTYTHLTALQNYGHYNQSLAHPLGANFIESVTNIRYLSPKRWFAELQLMYALQGKDNTNENWGSNVYISYRSREQEYDNRVLQGNTTSIFLADAKVGYLFNPNTNFRFELGYTYRNFSPEVNTASLNNFTTHYFHVGLVTRLMNQYYDF
jgi:hypothetical protein